MKARSKPKPRVKAKARPPGRKTDDGTTAFERLLLKRKRERYVLTLFVAGMTARSTNAVAMVRRVCEELSSDGYQLEVVDLYHSPERAAQGQILAAPTLVRESPKPVRRLIGKLEDHDRLVRGLGQRRDSDA